MKPLELVVPPKLGPEPKQWKVGIGGVLSHRRRVAAGIIDAKAKRFTDAELAAEYWRASSGADEVNYDRPFDAGSINGILHRFATLPHYDEVSNA